MFIRLRVTVYMPRAVAVAIIAALVRISILLLS